MKGNEMNDPKHLPDDIKRSAGTFLAKKGLTGKKLAWIVAVILSGLFVFSQVKGCMVRSHKPASMPRPVSIAPAVQRDVPVSIDSFGNMTTPNNTDVQSQVTGEIIEVHFKDGDEVRQGDLLFVIDSSLYKAAHDKALASISQDQVNLKLKKDTLERNKALVAKSLISQQDYEKLETDAASAQAQLELDKAAEEQARINLGYCAIEAPIAGLTSKRQVDVGNIITANTGHVLVNIKVINELYTDFTISERSLADLRKVFGNNKLSVLVSADTPDAKPREGQLIFLDNAVDNTTGTISLRAIVPNSDHYFWPGQFVRVKLVLSTLKDAVLVPSSAIQIGQNGAYLFAVKDDGTADLRFVKTGPVDGDFTVVYDNVKAGEKIVTNGTLMLRTGAAVIDASTIQHAMQEKTPAGRKETKNHNNK